MAVFLFSTGICAASCAARGERWQPEPFFDKKGKLYMLALKELLFRHLAEG